MKKIILLLLITNFLFAKGTFQINVGSNFSTFLNDKDADFLVGYTLGIKYEYFLSNSISIISGLLFSKEGGKLKNKIEFPYEISEGISNVADAYYEDIYAMIGYLRIPLSIGYSLKASNNTKIEFFLGNSFLIPIKDYSYIKNYRYAFTYVKGQTNYDFDYYPTVEESFFFANDLNYSLDIGLAYSYKKIMLNFELNYEINYFGYVEYISKIKKNLISGKLSISYSL